MSQDAIIQRIINLINANVDFKELSDCFSKLETVKFLIQELTEISESPEMFSNPDELKQDIKKKLLQLKQCSKIQLMVNKLTDELPITVTEELRLQSRLFPLLTVNEVMNLLGYMGV